MREHIRPCLGAAVTSRTGIDFVGAAASRRGERACQRSTGVRSETKGRICGSNTGARARDSVGCCQRADKGRPLRLIGNVMVVVVEVTFDDDLRRAPSAASSRAGHVTRVSCRSPSAASRSCDDARRSRGARGGGGRCGRDEARCGGCPSARARRVDLWHDRGTCDCKAPSTRGPQRRRCGRRSGAGSRPGTGQRKRGRKCGRVRRFRGSLHIQTNSTGVDCISQPSSIRPSLHPRSPSPLPPSPPSTLYPLP